MRFPKTLPPRGLDTLGSPVACPVRGVARGAGDRTTPSSVRSGAELVGAKSTGVKAQPRPAGSTKAVMLFSMSVHRLGRSASTSGVPIHPITCWV